MTRLIFASLLGAGLAIFAADLASAQYQQIQQGNPYYKPPVSPYLNVAGNNNPAINYFGIVRPQIAFNKQLQNLQYQQQYIGQQQFGVPVEEDETMPTYSITGHPATFNNLSHYFNNGPSVMGGNHPGQPQLPTLFGKRY
ncbi:MAG TPA: hypothetical protein VE988_17990 [Gemmataceae bacterium]|nr:hypothetical protein [Gemmataceae bacterium]